MSSGRLEPRGEGRESAWRSVARWFARSAARRRPPPSPRARRIISLPKLVIRTDRGEAPRPLLDPVVTIGRDPGCSIRLTEVGGNPGVVSRRHAELQFEADELVLRDMSLNGTFLNDERVAKSAPVTLKDGDVLSFGAKGNYHVTVQLPLVIEGEDKTSPITASRKFRLSELAHGGQYLNVLRVLFEKMRAARDSTEVYSHFLEGLLAVFPRAKRGLVLEKTPSGDWVEQARAGSFAGSEESCWSFNIAVINALEQQQEAVLSNEAIQEFGSGKPAAGRRIRSLMCAPIYSGGRLKGVVQVDACDDEPVFHETDLDALVCASFIVGDKIEQSEFQQFEVEMRTAREMQEALLPPKAPDIAGYDFASIFEPAKEVAGDLYDIITLSPRKHAIVLADVADKGVAAAMWGTAFAGYLRGLLCERSFDRPQDLAHVVTLVNREMCRSEGMKFASALVMVLDSQQHTLDVVNAGHQWPVYYCAARKHAAPLADAATNMIIGVSKEEEYRATRRPVRPGDYFVCFTDGVDEARDKPAREAGQRYGTRRVENVVARSAGDAPVAQDVAYAIHLDLTDFRAEQLDDACILCFGRRAEQPEQGAHETERLDEPAQ